MQLQHGRGSKGLRLRQIMNSVVAASFGVVLGWEVTVGDNRIGAVNLRFQDVELIMENSRRQVCTLVELERKQDHNVSVRLAASIATPDHGSAENQPPTLVLCARCDLWRVQLRVCS